MQQETSAQMLVRLTHASHVFDRAVDALMTRVRSAMGVPPAVAGSDSANDPERTAVEQELAALRERLQAFLPEFEQLYGSLLIEELGASQLPALLEALGSERVQRYFQARIRAEPRRLRQLSRLGRSMQEALRGPA